MDVSEAEWIKSTRSSGSGSSDCVEVARNLPSIVAVRDSEDSAGPALVFMPTQWNAFIGAAKNGAFDR